MKNTWQNWIVGDTPESCIPIGYDVTDENGNTVKIVKARTAEEASNKGDKLYNKALKKRKISSK